MEVKRLKIFRAKELIVEGARAKLKILIKENI